MTTVPIELIPATDRDFTEIETLYRAAIQHMQETGIDMWDYRRYPSADILRNDIRLRQLFTARHAPSGRIAVCVVLNGECDAQYDTAQWRFPATNPLIVHRLCVHPDFQRYGYGSAVMKHVLNQAETGGYESVRLDAFSRNRPSLGMYEKLGFRKAGEAHGVKGTFYLLEKDCTHSG